MSNNTIIKDSFEFFSILCVSKQSDGCFLAAKLYVLDDFGDVQDKHVSI